eukprot:1151015-Pelagomonas_calceolata.AAC.3
MRARARAYARAHAHTQTYLVFNGEVNEVGVNEDLVGRPKLRVVTEEQCCARLVPADSNSLS